jgi:hypothetical protein
MDMLTLPAIDFSIPPDEASLRPPARERFAPRLVRATSGEIVSIQDGRKLHLRAPPLSACDVRTADADGAAALPDRLGHRDGAGAGG